MGRVCEKLRDIQKCLFCNNENNLGTEIVGNLTKCETQIFKTKTKTVMKKYFKKLEYGKNCLTHSVFNLFLYESTLNRA